MKPLILARGTAALICLLLSAPASAAGSPTGVWIDHTGRGAVEITDCAGRLCGRIVWLADAKNAKACSLQVIGNVTPAGSNTWDGGWIYDPEAKTKYDVEIKQVSADTLKLTGYAGIKLFGQTMTWTRAPANLVKCKA